MDVPGGDANKPNGLIGGEIVKGVILAGGVGSRLTPLTEITNKHLLPVGKEPMLWHPVRQLVGSGMDEILVVTSTHHMGSVVQSLGSGKRFGCEFTYRVQEEAQGIAHALALAKAFSAGGRIVVLLGNNVFQYSTAPHVNDFPHETFETAQPSAGALSSRPQGLGGCSKDGATIIL